MIPNNYLGMIHMCIFLMILEWIESDSLKSVKKPDEQIYRAMKFGNLKSESLWELSDMKDDRVLLILNFVKQ
jgi:hypothetical protein